MAAQHNSPIKAQERWQSEVIAYSICTLVTRHDDYRLMVESFRQCGFNEPDCEFLYLDNSSANEFDAYRGCNLFLTIAKGRRIILCHQDIELINDGRAQLDAALAALDRQDPHWGLCGNGGGIHPGALALRISDPHGEDQKAGPFPAKVTALDENFIVVRREANLTLSRDIGGFHLYGADLCMIAGILGWNAYVIDFHLRHKSGGTKDSSFHGARERLIHKYRRALRSHWITTTCTNFFVSGFPGLGALFSSHTPVRIVRLLGRKSYRRD